MPADSHVGPYVSSIDPVVPPALNEAVPENFVHVTFSLTPLPDPSVVRAGEPTPSMVFAPLGVGLMCSVSNADANEGSARTDAPSAASRITVILFCMVLPFCWRSSQRLVCGASTRCLPPIGQDLSSSYKTAHVNLPASRVR